MAHHQRHFSLNQSQPRLSLKNFGIPIKPYIGPSVNFNISPNHFEILYCREESILPLRLWAFELPILSQ